MDETTEKKEPELKDFRFIRFRSINKMQDNFANICMDLTEEEMNDCEVVVGVLFKKEAPPSESIKNEVSLKRVLLYKGTSQAMHLTHLQSTVPMNGWKNGGDMKIFSKVIEYNGKCTFCNFNKTQDNNLLCYFCIKSFNEAKKIQMEGDSTE